MKDISVDQLRDVLTYDAETGKFVFARQWSGRRKGDFAGCVIPRGYEIIVLHRQKYRAHRLAWLYVYGEWPKGVIDHINGDKADNRICNLRDVTQAINSENRKVGKVGRPVSLMGVRQQGPRSFKASVQVNGVKHHLGVFPTSDLASQAYMAAKAKLHPHAVAVFLEENINAPVPEIQPVPEASRYLGHNSKKRPIEQLTMNGDPVRQFPSLHEAERATGIPHTNIGSAAKGRVKTAGGFKWRYVSREQLILRDRHGGAYSRAIPQETNHVL